VSQSKESRETNDHKKLKDILSGPLGKAKSLKDCEDSIQKKSNLTLKQDTDSKQVEFGLSASNEVPKQRIIGKKKKKKAKRKIRDHSQL
jgi:hypothetical protein